MVKLTETERIEILMMIGFGDRIRTQQEVVRLFNERHPQRPPITQSVVSRTEAKFRQFGHVRNLPKTGRPSEDETELNILLATQDSPHSSLRQLSLDFDVGKSSVCRILHKHKYHPYKIQLLHELNEDDFDRRNEFCEELFNICSANQNFVKSILFTDEATFHLTGSVNKQNFRYWAQENPHWMREVHTQYPQKVNVWCGIVGNTILGPYFFDDTLNGDRYLEFLRNELVPALAVLYPNPEDPDIPHNSLFFQQDGAPPHYAANVRHYLNETFPNRWIGRRGAIEWPARSPDLTPLDYFLWGYLKSKVYLKKPQNIEDLKTNIRQEVGLITPDVINNVQEEFVARLAHCQAVNGDHFEHLL